VDRSESGKWRNEVHCHLNRKTFFLYKDNKCHSIGAHENSMNATNICEKQLDTLKHGIDILKEMILQGLKEKVNAIRVPLTLQAEMCGQYEVDKHFTGYAIISLNGKNMFHVNTSTGNWTQLDPRFKKIIEMWKKDKVVAAFLERTIEGDFRTWLDELMLHWKEHLEPAEQTKQRTKNPFIQLGHSTSPQSSVCDTMIQCLCPLKLKSPVFMQIDLQSSTPPLLDDSLTLPETCSVKKEDKFLTASQNSVLLTSDDIGGNP
ncbi:UL16-binding protein 1-like, partial [Mus caroli]|uniref:UL16-binding protein 1-like n=1 Tax=Mus caroli TaxID=10089 RepID=A0A6P5P1T5_MUSCR